MATGVEKLDLTSGRKCLVLSGAQDLMVQGVNTTASGKRRPCRAICYSGATSIKDLEGDTVALPDTGGYFYLPIQFTEIVSGTNVICIW